MYFPMRDASDVQVAGIGRGMSWHGANKSGRAGKQEGPV
jgi:hypothetical protein